MTVSLIRTVLLYLFVVIALRIMGKRQIGELQPSELVATLLISDIAAVPMQETGIPLVSGLVPIFVLVALEILLSVAMLKNDKIRLLVSGKPIIIIQNGKILQNEMRRVRFSIEDLVENLRQQNIFRISDIAFGIVETNGKLSVLQKPEKNNVTAEMMNLSPAYEGLPIIAVSDGRIAPDALSVIGFDVGWLQSVLQKEKVRAEDIFIMTADKTGAFSIIKKEKKK